MQTTPVRRFAISFVSVANSVFNAKMLVVQYKYVKIQNSSVKPAVLAMTDAEKPMPKSL